MSEATDETPEERKAHRIELFAARSGRHRRFAAALIGAEDPLYALADLVVDHEARLDALADRLSAAEHRADRLAARLADIEGGRS